MVNSQKLDKLNEEQRAQAMPRLERISLRVTAGESKVEIARDEGISRTMLYRLIGRARRYGLLERT